MSPPTSARSSPEQKDESIPLLPLQDERARSSSCSGYDEQPRYTSDSRCRRILCVWRTPVLMTLAALTCSLPWQFYFGMPSTVWVYLSMSLLLLPWMAWQLYSDRTKSLRLQLQLDVNSPTLATTIPSILEKLRALPVLRCTLALWSLLVWISLGSSLTDRIWLSTSQPTVALPSALQQPGVTFLASNLYNSAHLFPRFRESLLQLCSLLGKDKAYLSIYESNSSDDTCDRLQGLRHDLDALGVAHSVRCGEQQQHRVAKGQSNSTSNERVAFLAAMRNEVLRPLDAWAKAMPGKALSKVLWINDVYFEASSALELLNTNSGNFDQACGIDAFPLGFYDTWVARDVDAQRLQPLWPYFGRSEDVTLMRRRQPILVHSCWNGIAAFDAAWYSHEHAVSTLQLFEAGLEKAQRWNASFPLRFRSRLDDACVSSECLLSSFDQHLLSAPYRPHIFIKPDVVVAYDSATYWWYQGWANWWPIKVWSLFWEDIIATRIFGWVANWGRKRAKCRESLLDGWAPPTAALRPLSKTRPSRRAAAEPDCLLVGAGRRRDVLGEVGVGSLVSRYPVGLLSSHEAQAGVCC